MRRSKIIDAEFEVVDGPYRVGDEHRTRKGWYLTDRLDRHGNPLWYKPPGVFSKWLRRIGYVLWLGPILLGVAGMVVAEFLFPATP